MLVRSRSQQVICEGPDRKRFRLGGPQALCCSSCALLWWRESSHREYPHEYTVFYENFIKTARFGPWAHSLLLLVRRINTSLNIDFFLPHMLALLSACLVSLPQWSHLEGDKSRSSNTSTHPWLWLLDHLEMGARGRCCPPWPGGEHVYLGGQMPSGSGPALPRGTRTSSH